MTRVVLLAAAFFVVSFVTVFAARRRWRQVEPLFPLIDDPRIPSHVVTSRGVDVPLGALKGWDLLEFTRCLAQIDRAPETADPTEALAW